MTVCETMIQNPGYFGHPSLLVGSEERTTRSLTNRGHAGLAHVSQLQSGKYCGELMEGQILGGWGASMVQHSCLFTITIIEQ